MASLISGRSAKRYSSKGLKTNIVRLQTVKLDQKIDWQAKLLEVIPLLVGIAITRRFNLQGWRAVLVYVLAAGSTRQVMEVLESEAVSLPVLAGGQTTGNGKRPNLQLRTPTESSKSHQVVHATPGRLRLRVPALAQNADYAGHLHRHLTADDRLQSVRVNPHTSSVTVKYDIEQFTEAEIQACLDELINLTIATLSSQFLSGL
jgi:hypothetical protein